MSKVIKIEGVHHNNIIVGAVIHVDWDFEVYLILCPKLLTYGTEDQVSDILGSQHRRGKK